MSRNIEQELNQIKEQIAEISGFLAKGEPRNTSQGFGKTGTVSYQGTFESGERKSTWVQNEVGADELLRLIENRMAEKVLSCIGSNDRLNLLLALLREPMTVAAIVEKCGYNSTGQVYHHLKPLIAADLIAEDKYAAKGTYCVQPHRVQGIIMLLAGIHDMLDVKHSQGNWEDKYEIHTGATMVDERYMVSAEETQKIIETFFSSTSPLILKSFSGKEKKKLVILKVISEQFEKGKKYSEKHVNDILQAVYDDYATIRRYLIEYGFMKRTQDCGEYWLK
jgi:Uncharacterized protein conserved in bacteria